MSQHGPFSSRRLARDAADNAASVARQVERRTEVAELAGARDISPRREVWRTTLRMGFGLSNAYVPVFTTSKAWRGCDVYVDSRDFGTFGNAYARVLVMGVTEGVGQSIAASGFVRDPPPVSAAGPNAGAAVWAAAARGITQRWTVLANFFATGGGAVNIPVTVVASDECTDPPSWVGEARLAAGPRSVSSLFPVFGLGTFVDPIVATQVTRIVTGVGGAPDSLDVHDTSTIAGAAPANQIAQLVAGALDGGDYRDPFAGYRFGSNAVASGANDGGLCIISSGVASFTVWGR